MRKYAHKVQRAKDKGDEASTIPCRTILEAMLPIVSKEIVTKCEKVTGQRSGIAQKYLRGMNPDILSLITLRAVLDGISSPRTLMSVSKAIGVRVEDEARFTALKPENLKKIIPAIKHKSDYSHRHIAATKYANVDYEDGWKSWGKIAEEGEKIQIHIGVFLLDAVLASTDLIRDILVVDYPSRSTGKVGITSHKIVATEETLKAIRARHLDVLDMFPEYSPTVIPPKPWTDFSHGGYYTDHIPQKPFVRTRWSAHRQLLKHSTEQMSEVYDAVNSVQETPWRINQKVYDTLQYYFENKIASAGLPYQDTIEPPCCPICGGAVDEAPHKCFETDEKALKVWKKLKFRWHKTIIANDSKTELVGKVLKIAAKYKDYPAIYFPMNCDFRGRIYAIPTYLNPQGCDYAKGLLEFVEGKIVDTPEALMWLKIAGANHYGIDKASFADRCKWVDDNLSEILRIAESPLDNTSWTKADEPWQYLAWCCDYAEYIKDPKNYKSHAVVAMDGSCNGLQHFSALLRDPVGARAVNLEPSEKPSDVYQIVADKVINKIKLILNNDKAPAKDREFAQRWMAVGITRTTTKRSVMIVPYSGTRMSCREYIQDFLEDKIDKNIEDTLSENYGSGLKYLEIDSSVREQFPFDSTDRTDYDTFKASSWLSKYVWDAIGETITSAKEAMSFLQSIAKLLAKENKPVCWTTPTGFPVRMSYFEGAEKTIKTKLQDTSIQLYISQETAQISASQQASSVSPNFIHSMDASCLVKTVNRCANESIRSFGMVHDSYGTVASDAPALAKILRQEFISLYEDNTPLEDLWNKTIQSLSDSDEIPALPLKGNFELSRVMESLYFFA